MKAPSELMSDKYCGPSKLIPLGQIRNEDGFRFIGIDKDGGDHFCIVRRGDSNSFYMNSNTALFSDLIGWIPDAQASNAGYCAAIAAQAKRIAELEAVGAVGVGAMMSKPDIATAIHYPAHWDTAAYPTLESALSELSAWFKCSECAQPAPAVVEPGPLQTVSVKHWAQRALEAQPKSDPEYWPLSYKAGHMEDELIELRAALKIAIAASPQPAPAVVEPVQFKGGMTATDQSRELDAGFAAQNYCRSKWGAARGHAEWRRYHDAFVAGYLAVPGSVASGVEPLAYLICGDLFHSTDDTEQEEWEMVPENGPCERFSQKNPGLKIPLYAAPQPQQIAEPASQKREGVAE